MKAIVFDNAGTIIKRVSALKDMSNKNIIFESNTIGLVNTNKYYLILVFQTPTKDLINLNMTIHEYLKKYPDNFEISYSNQNFSKQEVISALSNDKTTFNDMKDSAYALKNEYDIEICSGSALIVNMFHKKIEYVYTAGGVFFNGTKKLFNKLENLKYKIYIASGDNKDSLLKIASILNIPKSNVYDTCNRECKRKVVQHIQNKGYHTIMVGNSYNDEIAIKQADIGILTLEQGEQLSDSLINSADFTIKKNYEVLEVIYEK